MKFSQALLVVIATGVSPFAAHAQVTLAPLSGHTYTALSLPQSLAATNVQLFGVNDQNQVAGLSYEENGTVKGFIYSQGSYTQISVPSFANTAVFDINNNGQIIGTTGNGNLGQQSQGFLLSAASYQLFSIPGSTHFVPQSINDTGRIAGQSDNSAFSYDSGTFSTLTLPGNPSAYATGINNGNRIVGFSQSSGFLYSDGTYSFVSVPGATSTAATDINFAGEIVGTFADGGHTHSYFLSGGNFYEIAFPGASDTWVNGINSSGTITGFYALPGQPGLIGFVAATGAIPEPAAWGVLTALCALGAALLRRRASPVKSSSTHPLV